MAYDFLDLIVNSADEFLTGKFYRRRPVSQDDGAITFHYKQRDPNSRIFSTVLSNVRADSATYAITTNDFQDFNVGGYIVTQNGLIWEIVEVITNEQPKEASDVLRWFKTAKTAECSVRMIQVNDLFGNREAYLKECEVELTFVGYARAEKRIESAIVTDSASYNIAANVIRIYIDKGKSIEAYVTFEDGTEKTVVLTSEQTKSNKYESTILV